MCTTRYYLVVHVVQKLRILWEMGRDYPHNGGDSGELDEEFFKKTLNFHHIGAKPIFRWTFGR